MRCIGADVLTQEMYEKAVEVGPWVLAIVPDQYKTQGMCKKAVEKNPWVLKIVPSQYKTQ